jgi:hypothetical protein
MEVTLVTLGLALAGLWLLMRALLRLRRRRLVSTASNGLSGLALLLAAAAIFAVAANLHTYHRLTFEQPVAELTFEAIGAGRYRATLALADSSQTRQFELVGDQWQLDARILKWTGIANLLGLDARYRLERLGARFAELERERNGPRSVYALSENPGVDLWQLSQRFDWLALVDATYGSAAYLPMRDGARFEVKATQSGLVARPLNPPARQGVIEWSQ